MLIIRAALAAAVLLSFVKQGRTQDSMTPRYAKRTHCPRSAMVLRNATGVMRDALGQSARGY